MNLLCDFLLWATETCVILTFVFLAIAVVMLVVTVLWLEMRAIFCGSASQDSGGDETTLFSSFVLLGLSLREIFSGWSGD